MAVVHDENAPGGTIFFSYAATAPWFNPKAVRANQDLAATARVIAAGYAMISTTILNGRTVLRLCTINPRTTESDIKNTLELIVEAGARVKSEPVAG